VIASQCVQVSALDKFVGSGNVVQVYRTPGLSESAAQSLQEQAHAAGLTAIAGISMEIVRIPSILLDWMGAHGVD
jgi:hypothetical protein